MTPADELRQAAEKVARVARGGYFTLTRDEAHALRDWLWTESNQDPIYDINDEALDLARLINGTAP